MYDRPPLRLTVCLLLAAATAPTGAQSGPEILIEPWQDKPHWADTTDDLSVQNSGHDKRGAGSVKLFVWDSEGRIKFDRADSDPKFWLGYRVLSIDTGAESDTLPGGFTIIDLVGAAKLGDIGGGDSPDRAWRLTVLAGAGVANDNHFRNADGYYGIGAVNAARQLDNTSRIDVGVSYHGNRVFLPDVPLPYISYSRRVSDGLFFTVGLPITRVVWKPAEPLALEAEYRAPCNASVRAALYLTKTISLFGTFDHTLDGFHADELSDRRRIFFESNRVTAGVRWESKGVDVSAGVGYAFDQSFSTGWDVRDTNTFLEPSDEPMLLLRVTGTF